MRKLYLCLFIGILFTSTAQSQSSTPSIMNVAGGFSKVGYLQSEWSIGELCLIDTYTIPGFFFTQGVLQPCTDFVTKWPLTVRFLLNEYKLFPNPTSGKFEINFFLKIPGRLSLQLVNNLGQIIAAKEFRYEGCGHIERYNISGLPNGIYTLHANLVPDEIRSDGIISTRNSSFQIIKTN
jgi:Secretion system C-terminal sorting domain